MVEKESSAASWNEKIVEEFRANEGRVGGPFEGTPLALLTTTGARSGKLTTSPVMFLDDGDRLLVIASNAGAPNHPAWYHNLLANPEVTAEVGTETFTATATAVHGPERDRLYARMVEIAPGFAEYQEKTTRVIPVVALHRRH